MESLQTTSENPQNSSLSLNTTHEEQSQIDSTRSIAEASASTRPQSEGINTQWNSNSQWSNNNRGGYSSRRNNYRGSDNNNYRSPTRGHNKYGRGGRWPNFPARRGP